MRHEYPQENEIVVTFGIETGSKFANSVQSPTAIVATCAPRDTKCGI
jgi:hypothetical protein